MKGILLKMNDKAGNIHNRQPTNGSKSDIALYRTQN